MNIHKPKNIDIVITIPYALGWWSHIDQSCNLDQTLILANNLIIFSD